MKKIMFIGVMALALTACDSNSTQVVTINYTKLVENSKVMTEVYNREIRDKQTELSTQLEVKQKAAQEFRANCDKQNPVTDPSCNMRVTPADQEFAQYQGMAQQQMKVAGEKFNNEFNPYIVKAIEGVVKRMGNPVVLNVAGVVYSPTDVDITAKVGKYVDENYKK
jgi:Skp family chaperone for outer membrane proteins